MGEELLRAEGLTKTYDGVKVLDNVALTVESGAVIGLFGKNGSGKTTLLDIMAMALKQDSGKIYYRGEDVDKRDSLRRQIGYVPQDIALFEELTVKENFLCWSRLPKKEALRKVDELTEAFDLGRFVNKKVSNLSGGMKRRANFAVAFLGEPELLILDEPFSGIDMDSIGLIEEYMASVAQKGISQIISSHSPLSLMPLLDYVMVLSAGRLVYFEKKEVFAAAAAGRTLNEYMADIIRGRPA